VKTRWCYYMKWFEYSEKECDAGKTTTRSKVVVTFCIVIALFLLTCGSTGAQNTIGVNATATMAASTAIANANTSASPQVAIAAISAPIPVITASPVTLPPVNSVLEQAFVDRNIMRMRSITSADREAAAKNAAAKGLVVGGAANKGYSISRATNLTPYPGGTPDYWGPYPNYANSQLPSIDPTGKPVPGTGIRKFVDSLPGLGPTGANNLGKYIPVAVSDLVSYPGDDYYEIALVQYVEKMHSDLPPTTLRGYVQLETPNIGGSKHIALMYPNGSPILNAAGGQVFAYDNPRYLGPMIVAQRDKPVRVKFHNYLPTGLDGNLFIPVDTTIMGAGIGPLGLNTSGLPIEYSQNRASVHLHGGNTPWISDGTPHQWTTPAGENTAYPKGVSVRYVPDMDGGNEPVGTLTFYYTNQQSARLMFYHDHALGITRLNVYAGNAAGYIVRDPQETAMIASGAIPTDEIPLIIQDKTFIPSAAQMTAQDPTWNWGGNKSTPWPHTGDLWWPHVYMTNQNPYDISGANAMGRWDYGPWFWPPFTGLINGPVTNPYASASAPWEPPQIPGTPNPTIVPEGFMDTPVVNGAVYPYVQLGPHAYRFRILNACNDRYLNLQLYYAGSNATMWSGMTLLNGSAGEVPMVPAIPGAGLPPSWPTDGRDGGVPNPNSSGPSWIQIGTEGGFLPAPVVLPPQPVSYDYNRRTITVLDVLSTSLYLGPAERADVIVDFTGIPSGTKLILYNDAPVPNPAFDPRFDYYTNDPDQTLTGGAPTTVAGYGPNTRTIMQIQINGAIPATGTYVPGLINTSLPAAYGASQAPPIIPQASYNTAFNATYPVNPPYVRIQDTQLTFQPANQITPGTLNPSITMDLQPKSIIEDFDLDYGRMNAMLGVEVPRTNLQIQTSIPYFYVDPPTELFSNSINGTQIGALADGTQIWKVTHNGVDTHAIHWHMFNVQVLNRVGWDGAVKPPEAYELGWKETLKMRPLEDVIVAMRPITPNLPVSWGQLPNSIRPLDPTTPLGSATSMQFHNIDPTNEPATVINRLVNYGWEYVWHCHLLGHEENDMMRGVAVAVVPNGAPSGLTAGNVTDPVTNTSTVFLAWTDNSVIETDWSVQRFNSTNSTWIDMARVPSFTGPQTGGSAMAIVPISNTTPDNLWRVMASNVVGDETVYVAPASGYPTVAANSTPSGSVTQTTGNPAPGLPSFTGTPTTGNASLTVTFTSATPGARGWSWDFGDRDITNATGIQNPVHTYLNNGVYNVTLTAMNIGGNTSFTRTNYIIVGQSIPRIAPVANFTAIPLNGTAPLTVNFIDLSVNATAWNWTFGDNWIRDGVNMSNSTLQNPVHTYLTFGNYTVSLNVTNSANSSVMQKVGYITVTNATATTGVYRPGAGFYLKMDNGSTWNPSTDLYFAWDNAAIDRPIGGDWNGDGRSETGVYRPGVGFYLKMNNVYSWHPSTDQYLAWDNAAGDLPIAGDWNMDGRDETGVYRPGVGFYLKMDNGNTWNSSTDKYLAWDNAAGDLPVAGDWNADGFAETGVYRPGVGFYLKMDNGSTWTPSTDKYLAWDNAAGDRPVAGDWNADGFAETGVYRPGVGFYLKMDNGSVWTPSTDKYLAWDNAANDLPIAGNFV
jgi:PKD repeat protein/FtsP/CotA-like multicopper oxidase with cupredoxin domain